jgi:hypothetical protein
MTLRWDWLRNWATIIVAGVVFAIAVTEAQLAFGVDLLDVPFFHAPVQAIGLGAIVLAFAAFQARPSAPASARVAAVVAFGLLVMPYNALADRPAIPVDFWRGNAGLLVDRTMTVNRPHAVVLVIKGSQPIGKGSAPMDARDVLGADTIVARLSADPRPSFTLAPDDSQARPISLAQDLSWVWTVTPRQEGGPRLILELDALVKNRASADKASSLYRQYVRIAVQPPSWYEAARQGLIDLVTGS